MGLIFWFACGPGLLAVVPGLKLFRFSGLRLVSCVLPVLVPSLATDEESIIDLFSTSELLDWL